MQPKTHPKNNGIVDLGPFVKDRRFCLGLVVCLLFLFAPGISCSDSPSDPLASESGHLQSATAGSPKNWSPPRLKERQDERDAMVATISDYGLNDPAILKAMGQVPRHAFVLPRYDTKAYADTPLPIGYGQTISQPYIVAAMTYLLRLKADSRVLEIGTGSGYQAAVLYEFTPHVYTIEIIEPLAKKAAEKFKRLGYTDIQFRHADGYYGWKEVAPFDAIIVTAAAAEIPQPLIDQLATDGRMVIPLGGPFAIQQLVLIIKHADGRLTSQSLMSVRFVPFTRGKVDE